MRYYVHTCYNLWTRDGGDVAVNLDSYPELLTVPEVAGILRVDRSYVYRLIRQGRLPILRITPHKTRVLKTDLNSFLGAARLGSLGDKAETIAQRDQA